MNGIHVQKTGRKFIERVEGFEYERDGSKLTQSYM